MPESFDCLLIVTAEVDAAVEAEWNHWYDTVHLPDALKCPGVRRGRRYVCFGRDQRDHEGQEREEHAAHLYDDLRAREPGRHQHAGVPGHAGLV
jgi:hypothetical protein